MHSETELQVFAEWERESWERQASAYATSLGDLTRGSIGALLDAASVGPGTRLLDVGSGPGFVALAAAERGAIVRAADQSSAMVEIARARQVDAVVASVERLPFGDAEFDGVVAAYLFNHLAHPEDAVAELARLLPAGGQLAFTVWDTPDANAAIGLIASVVRDQGLTAVVPPGPDAYRFSDDHELHTLLTGWDDVVIQRPKWIVPVSPGEWFDALGDATPRAGAALAQAGPQARAEARRTYVEVATRQYGTPDGHVDLPAAAVLVSARKASPA